MSGKAVKRAKRIAADEVERELNERITTERLRIANLPWKGPGLLWYALNLWRPWSWRRLLWRKLKSLKRQALELRIGKMEASAPGMHKALSKEVRAEKLHHVAIGEHGRG